MTYFLAKVLINYLVIKVSTKHFWEWILMATRLIRQEIVLSDANVKKYIGRKKETPQRATVDSASLGQVSLYCKWQWCLFTVVPSVKWACPKCVMLLSHADRCDRQTDGLLDTCITSCLQLDIHYVSITEPRQKILSDSSNTSTMLYKPMHMVKAHLQTTLKLRPP